MRRRLWQLHSWFGLIAGLGLLVIGATGSLLVFHDEIEAWLHPEYMVVAATPAGRLAPDALLAAAHRALPDYEVTGWLVRGADEAGYADALYVIRHGGNEWQIATLDPYTGGLLASPRPDTRTFTGWLLELHYTFFAGHAGLLAAGLFAVLLCALGLTGAWLYRDFWRHVFTLRWGRGARLLFSDLHKFVGITTVAFNFVLGFTGAYWNLPHVLGEWTQSEPAQPKIAGRLYGPALSLDRAIADAARRLPGFQTNFISLPSQPGGNVVLYGAPRAAGFTLRSPYGSTVSYDAQTGAHLATYDLRTAGAWTQAVDAFRPLHYGTFGGWPIKVLWTLGGLAPGVLAVSGFALWWLRRRSAAADSRRLRPARDPRPARQVTAPQAIHNS